ncbi:hypothetical protein ACFQZZ_31905 [Nocardia sp. GCM10030253]
MPTTQIPTRGAGALERVFAQIAELASNLGGAADGIRTRRA